MNKVKFIMMVGLPGSGKSTQADYIKQTFKEKGMDCVILSSDALRKELYGDENDQAHNGEIFNEMQKRAQENLKNKIHTIYDATNISSKRRANFLKHQLAGIYCEKICVYVATDWYDCISNDSRRIRKVGTEVIMRMRGQLQTPMYCENWDNIKIVSNQPQMTRDMLYDFKIENYRAFTCYLGSHSIAKECIDFAQDNPHHTFSVSRHMYRAYELLKGTTPILEMAGMLHDIAKPICKKFGEDGYAHYFGHAELSAQLAIDFMKRVTYLSDEDIIHIATLIQLHMRFFDVAGLPKLKAQIGEEMFNELVLLHEADIKAK